MTDVVSHSCFTVCSTIRTLHTAATHMIIVRMVIACHMPSESREALLFHYFNCVIAWSVLCANGT